jgi:hypothetical protein
MSSLLEPLQFILQIIYPDNKKAILPDGVNFSWDDVITLAKTHRLIPILHRSLLPYQQEIPSNTWQQLSQMSKRNSVYMLALTAETNKIFNLFSQSNISTIILKGPLLSLQLYNDIGLRQCRDIDLLIQEKDIPIAFHILEKQGYTFDNYEKKKRLSINQMTKYYNYAGFKSNTFNIELHWRFYPDKHVQNIPENLIWNEEAIVKYEGLNFRTLALENNFLYLCFHAAKHEFNELYWLYDILIFYKKNKLDLENIFTKAEIFDLKKTICLCFYLMYKLWNEPIPETLKPYIHKHKLLFHYFYKHIFKQFLNINNRYKFQLKIHKLFYRIYLTNSYKYFFHTILLRLGRRFL